MATCRLASSGPAVVGHNWHTFHSSAGPALAVRDCAAVWERQNRVNPGTMHYVHIGATWRIRWMICAQRRCGLLSNYFDHLLFLDHCLVTETAYNAILSYARTTRNGVRATWTVLYIGLQSHNFVPYLCQLVFATILWVKLLEMFVTMLSLKYAFSEG